MKSFTRGYAIGLFNPKNPRNVGSVMRAAGCFGAKMVAYTGKRVGESDLRPDKAKARRSVPLIHTEDLRGIIPYGYCPVAVDLVEHARCITTFQHPPQAFYVFGPEDSTLGEQVLSWCERRIVIPTRLCLNLAGAVHVVCYDRVSKEMRADKQREVYDAVA